MLQDRIPFSRQAYLHTDELFDAASGTSLRIDCLGAAAGLSHIRQISHPGRWGFDSLELAAHVRADGNLEDDMAAFLFIERSQGSSIAGLPLDDRTVLSLPPGGEIKACMRSGAIYRGVVVPAETWLAIQQKAVGFIRAGGSGASILRLDTNAGLALFDDTARLGDRLDADISRNTLANDAHYGLPLPLADCLERLAEIQAWAPNGYEAINRCLDARLRHAWRAKDFIVAHLADENLSVNQLCDVVNVSRRQLEYAFRATFDCSPYAFIQSARLNEIRRQLLRGDCRTVTEIALENGIQHLGRFSVAYRNLFGELPKATARKGTTTQTRNLETGSRLSPPAIGRRVRPIRAP